MGCPYITRRSHPLSLARREPFFKIGEYEWCEPDYRQILRWAESLALEPEEVIRRLLDRRSLRYEDRDSNPVASKVFDQTIFQDGRIRKLNWDFDLLPCADFQWVDGLEIEYLRIAAEPPPLPTAWREQLNQYASDTNEYRVIERHFRCSAWRTLPSKLSVIHLTLPKLQTFICHWLLLDELDLSRLPSLESLCCSWNRLTDLNLSEVPKLKELDCSWNQFRHIYGLCSVPELLSLNCSCNRLTDIGFSEDQDLEHVDCFGNDIETLDVRPLRNLKSLGGLEQEGYQRSYVCRVVQRPDQHFQ